jgi:hypothetical protein
MVASYKGMGDVATLTFNCKFLHYCTVALFNLDKQCICLACESLRVLEASHTVKMTIGCEMEDCTDRSPIQHLQHTKFLYAGDNDQLVT